MAFLYKILVTWWYVFYFVKRLCSPAAWVQARTNPNIHHQKGYRIAKAMKMRRKEWLQRTK